MSEPDEAMVEAVAEVLWEGNSTPFICWADLSEPLREMQYEQARAVLSVPVVRDALARDAQVREIATKWPERRNEPWPLTLALEVADEIAHLYPSPGDDSDIMPGSEFDGPVVL